MLASFYEWPPQSHPEMNMEGVPASDFADSIQATLTDSPSLSPRCCGDLTFQSLLYISMHFVFSFVLFPSSWPSRLLVWGSCCPLSNDFTSSSIQVQSTCFIQSPLTGFPLLVLEAFNSILRNEVSCSSTVPRTSNLVYLPTSILTVLNGPLIF